ncbi:MAG TPA: HlyD family type I secretion periplasmic adaptor subunit [Rhodopila sp.]|jgi:HlyD family secretion protein
MTQALTTIQQPPWIEVAAESLPGGSLRRIAILTLLTIVVGFGGLVTWTGLAHVESAVPGTGVIVAGGKRKTVSLVESASLRELLVHEGDTVAKGQILFRLDDVQMRAARGQASVVYWASVARLARLTAEAAGKRDLSYPAAVRDAAASDPAVAAAVHAEGAQFKARWAALDSASQVQQTKIAQQLAHIESLRAQLTASTTHLALVQEELHDTQFLLARGLSTKPRDLELRQTEADLRGQVGQISAGLAEAMQAIAQIQSETANITETRNADIARESSETQATRADAEQRLRAADDLLSKREITAPEAGTVTDIRLFTPGSSIQAGQPVMDLVPNTPDLLVEAKVAPNEVEHLAVGQRVNIRLSAYKVHRVPVIPGRLAYVGADRQDDANNQAYFLVRATVDADALKNKPGVVLLPGMPADVLIVNGGRTVLDFLISPLTDSLHHAMKEE